MSNWRREQISERTVADLKAGRYAKWFGEDAVVMEHKHHYSGSPPPAFGLSSQDDRKWPILAIRVSFPCGREDLLEKLAERLKPVLDDFMIEEGLDE